MVAQIKTSLLRNVVWGLGNDCPDIGTAAVTMHVHGNKDDARSVLGETADDYHERVIRCITRVPKGWSMPLPLKN